MGAAQRKKKEVETFLEFIFIRIVKNAEIAYIVMQSSA